MSESKFSVYCSSMQTIFEGCNLVICWFFWLANDFTKTSKSIEGLLNELERLPPVMSLKYKVLSSCCCRLELIKRESHPSIKMHLC